MPYITSRQSLRLLYAITYFMLATLMGVDCHAQDTATASPTTWVSTQGKSIEAAFVRMSDDAVVLKLNSTGKEVNVPLSSLSLESHLQALKLADPAAFSKPLVNADQPPEIEPFVPSVTISGAEMLVSPFGTNPTIESFLDTFEKELDRGNAFVAWHSLPPRMQADLDTIMTKVMGSVTPQQMIQLRTLFKSLRTIAVDKQAYILGHPMVDQIPDGETELAKFMPIVGYLAEGLFAEKNWQVENFQQGKVVPWLAEMCSYAAPVVHELIEMNVPNGNGASVKQKMIKFENIWIDPAQMTQMRTGVDKALKDVENGIDTAPLSIALLGLNAIAGKLARAESQEEFNTAVDELMELPGIANLSDAIQMQANMGGQGMGGPGMGNAGMGGPGMGAPGMGAPGMAGPGMGAPPAAGGPRPGAPSLSPGTPAAPGGKGGLAAPGFGSDK